MAEILEFLPLFRRCVTSRVTPDTLTSDKEKAPPLRTGLRLQGGTLIRYPHPHGVGQEKKAPPIGQGLLSAF